MHHRVDPSGELRRLAAEQGGVLTRGQAEQLGFGARAQRRLVDQGHWQRMAPGILLTRPGEPDWAAVAWAGVLQGGESARLGGLAAAYLHRLTDAPPERVLVLVSHQVHRSIGEPWRLRRERSTVRPGPAVGAPPRTSIEDTVLDLCDTRFPDGGRSPLAWVTDAVQRRLTTTERLQRTLQRRQRIGGRADLKELLGDVQDGVRSPLEWRYLRDVEKPHGLPRGRRQVAARSGGRAAYRDVRYDEFAVLVELDGTTGHTGMDRFRDFRRDNAALLEGDLTLRYGTWDVGHEPCAVARQVADLLIMRGWEGPFKRCPRCPSDR